MVNLPDFVSLLQKQLKKPSREEEELIKKEAAIGGQLFGPLPEGRQREFYREDKYVWIWRETWQDQSGKTNSHTVRYEVQPDRVVKFQNGRYVDLGATEARRLYTAALAYYQKTKETLYQNVTVKE